MTELTNCLILADGTVLENSSCGFGGADMWCWIKGLSMVDCFRLFSDPDKTSEITVRYTLTGITYRGFTDLLAIKKGYAANGEEQIDIRLCWPEGGEHSIHEFYVEDEDKPEETPEPSQN